MFSEPTTNVEGQVERCGSTAGVDGRMHCLLLSGQHVVYCASSLVDKSDDMWAHLALTAPGDQISFQIRGGTSRHAHRAHIASGTFRIQ